MKGFSFVTIFGLVAFVLPASTAALQTNIPTFSDDEAGIAVMPNDGNVSIVEPMKIKPLPIDEEDELRIGMVSSMKQKEDVVYAVISSEAGYARTTNVGIVVQKGTIGVLRYRIRVKAIEAAVLAQADKSFNATLTEDELKTYSRMKQDYKGGLDIPFLSFIGVNLNERVTRNNMEEAHKKQVNYNEKASMALEVLQSAQKKRIEISGTLRAIGVSFIPTKVFSFIKIAKVQSQDGSLTTVLSTYEDDLVAATSKGEVVPSEEGTIQILDI